MGKEKLISIGSGVHGKAEIKPVSAALPPTADFSTSFPGLYNVPQFTDDSVAAGGRVIAAWLWGFDDPLSGSANESTIQNPTHTFAVDGEYDVSLKVTDDRGQSNTIVKQCPIGLNVTWPAGQNLVWPNGDNMIW